MIVLALSLSSALILQEAPREQSLGEQDAPTAVGIFEQVYERWRINCDVPGIRDLRIAFDVTLDADGALVGQPRPVRPRNTPIYRAAADGARRALIDSSPFAVPDGYTGGEYRPVFNFARACARPDED